LHSCTFSIPKLTAFKGRHFLECPFLEEMVKPNLQSGSVLLGGVDPRSSDPSSLYLPGFKKRHLVPSTIKIFIKQILSLLIRGF
jgi:hypothetical protein